MSIDEAVEHEQSLVPIPGEAHNIEIQGAAAVKMHTFDLARHVATAPDGKSYVVATYDDRQMERGYVTSVYPQQGGYLTLLRLVVSEWRSEMPDEAIQRHITTVQAIQNGTLNELLKR
jgi:hypothetical protein